MRLNFSNLTNSAIGVFVVRGVGAVLHFGLQIFLARTLGVEGYGIISLATVWVMAFLPLSKLGTDTTLVRFLPRYSTRSQPERMLSLLRFAYVIGSVTSIMSIFALFGVTYLMPAFDSFPTKAFTATAILLFLLTLLQVSQGALRGLQRPVLSRLPEQLIRPIAVGIFLVFALVIDLDIGVSEVIWIMSFGTLVSVLWAIIVIYKMLPIRLEKKRSIEAKRTWLLVSVSLAGVAVLDVALARTDFLMLGAYVSDQELGIYSAATRLVALLVFGLGAVMTVIGPFISAAHSQGDMLELGLLLKRAARLNAFVSIPAIIALFLGGGVILDVFGSEFAAGLHALQILILGQAVNVVCGPVVLVLNMIGHHAYVVRAMILSLFINIALCLFLIPRFGIEGAAIATTASKIILNIGLVAVLFKYTGLDSTIFSIFYEQRRDSVA